ncbi:hypothetical protein QBC39DRAFT_401250 [Podospora conica]|nr:hypothetical protein QBC39DRAFT_401250 [Schizothecium conicum]
MIRLLTIICTIAWASLSMSATISTSLAPPMPAATPLSNTSALSPRAPKNPENEAGGKVTYPWSRAEPTFNNAVNETELWLVRECLALWCEQDELLHREAGLASCYTQGFRPEGGVMAYICNFRQVARCSRHDVNTAIEALEQQGSRTGLYHHVPTKKFGLAIGFDRFCEGSGFGCGWHFDPMLNNCRDTTDKMMRARVQYSKLVTGASDVQVYEYEGITWLDEEPH